MQLEFWFEFASTDSYLAASRVEAEIFWGNDRLGEAIGWCAVHGG